MLPNKCELALSWDQGTTCACADSDDGMLWLLDGEQRTYDSSATGSVSIVESAGSVGSALRMYYAAIGEYFERALGVETGHGDTTPRIGIGRAVSEDGGKRWTKPMEELLVAPRGHEAMAPTGLYEYINSPFVMQTEDSV